MARAYRHFIPGYIWHITHRCHKRDFLLKFAKDRTRWIELLFEAKIKFRLSILNFIVTSNHIHLILSSEWKWSGYHEIQHPKNRYRLIDHKALLGQYVPLDLPAMTLKRCFCGPNMPSKQQKWARKATFFF